MSAAKKLNLESHVVDILGSTRGRDQPIMLMEKAFDLVSTISEKSFLDENCVFFDPFCKAGEILLAAALKYSATTKKKNLISLSEEDIEKILYSDRFFGLGPDERHFLLTKRTFCGNERSHKPNEFENFRNGNYLSETDGRLDEKRFEKELARMIDFITTKKKNCKIIAIGNPPYQESDGGAQASAKPIYNLFAEALMNSSQISEFALVIPARWFSAGKGLDSFRDQIMNSSNIRSITYFERAEEVFPTVQIKGGVCFLNWNKDHKGATTFISNGEQTELKLNRFDIILDDTKAYSIVEKVIAKSNNQFVSESAWPRKPFGLPTNYFTTNSPASKSHPDALPCFTTNRNISYVLRSKIRVNQDKIDTYKVAIPRAYGKGMSRCTLPQNQIFIIGKGEVTIETYNIVGSFNTKSEAERFAAYLRTDFSRYMLGLRKLTQDIPRDRWDWVPLLDNSRTWTDELLFDYFNLNAKERAHIKKKVKEWS